MNARALIGGCLSAAIAALALGLCLDGGGDARAAERRSPSEKRSASVSVAKGWKAPVHNSRGERLAYVTGDEARIDFDNLDEIPVKGLRVILLSTRDGSTNLIVECDDAVFNRKTREAKSDGLVRAWSGDGGYRMTGIGFDWKQTGFDGETVTNRIFIRSKVETRGVKPAREKEGAGPGKSQRARPEARLDADAKPLHITSDKLEVYATSDNSRTREDRKRGRGFARYSGNVRVTDPSGLTMTSDLLEALTEESVDRVTEVVARGTVTVRGEKDGRTVKAAGDVATYSVEKRRIEMPDRPIIVSDGNLLVGDDVAFETDAEENITISAEGDARLKVAAKEGDKPSEVTAGFIRIDQKSGAAHFEGDVRAAVGTEGLQVRSEALDATFDETTKEVVSIAARRSVEIDMEADGRKLQLLGDTVDYDKKTGDVALSGTDGAKPKVIMGETVLTGRRMDLNIASRTNVSFAALGDGHLSLLEPDENIKERIDLWGDSIEYGDGVLQAKGGGRMVMPDPVSDSGKPLTATADWIEVDQKKRTVICDGDVWVVDSKGMKVGCDRIETELPEDGKPVDLTALGNVSIVTVVDGERYTAEGGQAVYTASEDFLVLTEDAILRRGAAEIEADQVVADRLQDKDAARLLARGNAIMKLDVAEWSKPKKDEASAGKTEAGEGKAEEEDKKKPKPMWARADEIIFDQKQSKAFFTDNVRVWDADGMEVTCGKMEVTIPRTEGEVPSVVATENVFARMPHPDGAREMRSQRAVYYPKEDYIHFTGGFEGTMKGGVAVGGDLKYYRGRKDAGGTVSRLTLDLSQLKNKRKK